MDYYEPMPCFSRLFPLLFVCVLSANAAPPAAQPAEPISSALDSELFYQLLLGELNARQGEPLAAHAMLLDAARKTNDARLYERSVELALQARSGDAALRSARAWSRAMPSSKQANRYVLQILIGLNRLGETLEPIRREIAMAAPTDRSAALSAIPRYFARVSDKKLAAGTVEQALADYLTSSPLGAAAWSVVGQMRLAAQDADGAIDAVHKAQAMNPQAQEPALLALSMMVAKTPQAEAAVQRYLEANPQGELRLGYARALVSAQRYADASAQLQRITNEKPDQAEAWLIRGLLELQDSKPAAAEISLKRFIELALARKETSSPAAELGHAVAQAYFALSQIAEQRKDLAAADGWLVRIDNAEDLLGAQLRRAGLLARQGKLQEARKLIHEQPEKSAGDSRLKVSAEVQLLREARQFEAVYDLLGAISARDPHDFDLMYELAMAAEKLGHLDEMERLLRSVMVGKPEDAQAYNALGYSLAQRNTRLSEARQLILRALELAPGDPFISDSLGWAEFRSGNLSEAVRLLQGAFETRADAEIAAHLGEVLWAMGQQERARAVWRQGLGLDARNETLQETLQRLRVKL